MKKTNFILMISAVVLVLLIIGLFWSEHLSGVKSGAVSEVKAGGVYYCPMHVGVTSDKPGDCIICGMKLIKKSEPGKSVANSSVAQERDLSEICIEHQCAMKDCPMHVKAYVKPGEKMVCPVCGDVISTGEGKGIEVAKPQPLRAEAGFHISPQKQELIGIQKEVIQKRPLRKVIRAFGKIAYDPQLYVVQEEYLQALETVQATKDSVEPAIAQQSADFLKAVEKKLQLLGMNPAEIEALAKAGESQENLYLPAGHGSVWAYVSVYEYEIGMVKESAVVEVEAVAYPGEVFKGKVISVNPVLDAQTRTNQVRAEIENQEGKLKPEMAVNANIIVILGEKLSVPESAVLDTGLRKVVFAAREGDVLESREVRLGQKAQGYYEVLDGLKENDVVVTSGNFLVDSESKLQSSLSSPSHQHGQ